MTAKDNITLPREVAEAAVEALMVATTPIPADRHKVIGAIEALRTALAAEQPKPSEDVEALRRDAERYRWLRGEHSRIDPCIKANAKYRLQRDSGTWVEIHDLDAAIDAAMGDKT